MTSAVDGRVWSASHPGRALAPGTPSAHCTGGWMDPRGGLNTEARGKIGCFCRGSNLEKNQVELQESVGPRGVLVRPMGKGVMIKQGK
jgi:hypothetical protein